MGGIITSGNRVLTSGSRVLALGGDPRTIPNLVTLLDAQMQTGYANLAAIPSLTDFSNNGNSFSQATAANQPTYRTAIINGLPVFRFDGSNDFMQGNNLQILRNVSGVTFFCVYKKNSTTGTQYIFNANEGTLNQIRFAFVNNINATFLAQSTFKRLDGGATDFFNFLNNDTAAHVCAIRVNYVAGNATMWMDNAQPVAFLPTLTSSGGNTSNTNSAAIFLGSVSTTTSYFNGDLGTMAVCNAALGDSIVLETMGMLKTRWGL